MQIEKKHQCTGLALGFSPCTLITSHDVRARLCVTPASRGNMQCCVAECNESPIAQLRDLADMIYEVKSSISVCDTPLFVCCSHTSEMVALYASYKLTECRLDKMLPALNHWTAARGSRVIRDYSHYDSIYDAAIMESAAIDLLRHQSPRVLSSASRMLTWIRDRRCQFTQQLRTNIVSSGHTVWLNKVCALLYTIDRILQEADCTCQHVTDWTVVTQRHHRVR
jgi:hypothetical protein